MQPRTFFQLSYRATTAGLALLALVLGGAVAMPATAQLPGENSNIQLKFVMTPAKTRSGRTEMRPLTPIFTVPKAEHVPAICQQAARITDTLVAYFNKYPPTIGKDRHVDLDGVSKKVIPYVNHTLGEVMVNKVVFLEGGGKELSRGSMSRLPFASIGCGRVLEEYETRLKELTGKGEK